MDIRKYFIFIFLSICIINSCGKRNPSAPDESQDNEFENDLETVSPLKILFIGSSYFGYNDLPLLFESMANSTEKKPHIESSIVFGQFLDFHVNSPATQELINSEEWDFVILQGACINTAYLETPDFYPYYYPPLFPALRNIFNQIKNNNNETVVIYCMPWAFEDGMTWIEGGTDTYETMQQKIYDNTLGFQDSLDIGIAPVGWAFNEIMLEDPPLHYLYMEDFNHPSLKGSYLMACVLYASVYQDNPENIPFTSTFSIHIAEHFKDVANRIVLNDFSIWNIPTINH